jgi:hypothetical protein
MPNQNKDVYSLEQDIINSNEEIYDSNIVSVEGVNVYSRDWTVATILQQIKQGNIALSPKFQRRNAWTDEKRSRLIESLILNLPIPEIVLAENPYEKGKFIVIDGRQRLMTIYSFLEADQTYWANPKTINLIIAKDINNKSYADLDESQKNRLDNASIRCTVIFGHKDDGLLYEIFHRINAGAVPLSTQELRQALFKGHFSDFLLDKTNDAPQPIHKVLGIEKPHDRLLDCEILLKFFAYSNFSQQYNGDLKSFLDSSTKRLNEKTPQLIDKDYEAFNRALSLLSSCLGDYEKIGHFINTDNIDRFNSNLFVLQVCYFALLPDHTDTQQFKSAFQQLCSNSSFIDTFKSNTAKLENVKKRFSFFEKMLNSALKTNFHNQFFIADEL